METVMTTAPAWLAVASAEHVRIGRAGGFAQVCHGKAGPLRRMRTGDGIVYYSPSEARGRRDGRPSFTAIGRVADEEIRQVEQFPGFFPYRRRILWAAAREIALDRVRDRLSLTAPPGWGASLRFGLVKLAGTDFDLLWEEMAARSAEPAPPAAQRCLPLA